MVKIKSSIFVGIELSAQIERELDPALMRLFDTYFDSCKVNGSSFLGKQLDDLITIEQLELCETHLMSLYRRVLPKVSSPYVQCFALTE